MRSSAPDRQTSAAADAIVGPTPKSGGLGGRFARFRAALRGRSYEEQAAMMRPGAAAAKDGPAATDATSTPAEAATSTPAEATSTPAEASEPAAAADPLEFKDKTPGEKVAEEQVRVVLGVEIVGRGVAPGALDACERFVVATVGRRPDIQKRLAKEKVVLVIIPSDKKMTEVAEFKSLAGTKTFDGRVWDDVRGSGGMRVGGKWAIGVPEENLASIPDAPDAYGDGFSVGLHEFAHTIEEKGVSKKEHKEIQKLYEARKKAGGPWTDAYASSNDHEYFAQATNAFFGWNKGQGENGPEWIEKNDPPLYAYLLKIYGPPPKRAEDAAPAAEATGPAAAAAS